MTATIVCAAEMFSLELVAEAAPLLEQHYQEIAWCREKIPLDPDYSRYAAGQHSGAIRVFTARQDGELIGYAVYIVGPHLHYKQTMWAMNDVLFVAEGRRGYRAGSKLIRFAEEAMRLSGVQVIGLHIKDANNWGPLAKFLGYERVETNWLRWIGG